MNRALALTFASGAAFELFLAGIVDSKLSPEGHLEHALVAGAVTLLLWDLGKRTAAKASRGRP